MASKKRLIDANALLEAIKYEYDLNYGEILTDRVRFADMVDDATTVDAVEVVHGRFIENRCSICGKMPMGEEIFEMADIEPPRFDWFMNYCPDCGAKMDGERKEK